MRKFKFKLQKVLEYRRLQEEWSETAYRESMAKLNDGRKTLTRLKEDVQTAQLKRFMRLDEKLSQEAFLDRLRDQVSIQNSVLGFMETEAETLRTIWLQKREEAEAMQTLHDNAKSNYDKEAAQLEQKMLDEMAITRRKAA